MMISVYVWLRSVSSVACFRGLFLTALAIGSVSDQTVPPLHAVEIIDLGTFEDAPYSSANGVSADGLVVVGWSGGGDWRRAFRWTSSGGLQDLGTLPGGNVSSAWGVSSDGTVVVGEGNSPLGGRAFRWTSSSGMQSVGALTFPGSSSGFGISADGSAVVGESYTPNGTRAFRWTASDGMRSLGTLGNGRDSAAFAASENGSVIVGYSGSVLSPGIGNRAFRWTFTGGNAFGTMQNLGVLDGGLSSFAWGISDDGSTAVGQCDFANGQRAFRWTSSGGMQNLGVLADGHASVAHDASSDGFLVVGRSDILGGGVRAFVWDRKSGRMQNLQVMLSTGSATGIENWTRVENAFAVSGDNTYGYNIVGEGIIGGQLHAFLVRGLTIPVRNAPITP